MGVIFKQSRGVCLGTGEAGLPSVTPKLYIKSRYCAASGVGSLGSHAFVHTSQERVEGRGFTDDPLCWDSNNTPVHAGLEDGLVFKEVEECGACFRMRGAAVSRSSSEDGVAGKAAVAVQYG